MNWRREMPSVRRVGRDDVILARGEVLAAAQILFRGPGELHHLGAQLPARGERVVDGGIGAARDARVVGGGAMRAVDAVP